MSGAQIKAQYLSYHKNRRSKKVRDKGRGSLWRPPAVNTAPQSGSGDFVRWSEFQLLAVAGGRKQGIQSGKRLISGFQEVAVSGGFGVFRGNSAGITAGVSFHPLGSSRGPAIPQDLQPCQSQQSPDGDKGKGKAALQDAPAFTKRRPREAVLVFASAWPTPWIENVQVYGSKTEPL